MNDEIVTDEDELIDQVDQLLACSNDPLRFVELAFPIIPEQWQREVLTHIGDRLSANARLFKYDPIRLPLPLEIRLARPRCSLG